MSFNHELQQPMAQLFKYLKPNYNALSFAAASSIINKGFDLPPVMVGWIVNPKNLFCQLFFMNT